MTVSDNFFPIDGLTPSTVAAASEALIRAASALDTLADDPLATRLLLTALRHRHLEWLDLANNPEDDRVFDRLLDGLLTTEDEDDA